MPPIAPVFFLSYPPLPALLSLPNDMCMRLFAKYLSAAPPQSSHTWSAARAKSNRGERPSLATEKLVFQLGELWAANATTVFQNLRLSQSLSKPSPLPLSFKGFTQYKHRSRKGREADFGCTAWITYGTRWTSLSMLSALAVMAPEGWPIPPYAVPP